MRQKLFETVISAFVVSAMIVIPAVAQEMKPTLTAASAKAIISGCEAFAEENDLNVNIAVLDQGKNLVGFLRMDGAPLGSIEISQWKANATASFPRATKGAAERAREFPALGFAPNIAIFEGGEAIFTKDGAHLGGVGVSGATGAEDAACARAGIAKAGLFHSRDSDG
ncbi:MAG: heme-binding protein [Alphaproteobacteria bacterium]|nr:heme-binding protein [Alphaproteobacteria bacterium]